MEATKEEIMRPDQSSSFSDIGYSKRLFSLVIRVDDSEGCHHCCLDSYDCDNGGGLACNSFYNDTRGIINYSHWKLLERRGV